MKTTYYKRVEAEKISQEDACNECDLEIEPDCMELFDGKRSDYFLSYCKPYSRYKKVDHLTKEQMARATFLRSENEVESNS